MNAAPATPRGARSAGEADSTVLTGSSRITLQLDGVTCTVARGTTVAAALAQHGSAGTRRSVAGAVRAPFCGMGVCHECRVDIDGLRRLACQVLCRDGMQVRTDLSDRTSP